MGLAPGSAEAFLNTSKVPLCQKAEPATIHTHETVLVQFRQCTTQYKKTAKITNIKGDSK